MLSFDDFPVVYFMLGYVLAAVIVLLVYWNKLRFQEAIFLLLSGILVVVMRLPILIFNQEINPDESQMIAHAITLRQFPIYWQSVDGTTIGPLDNYILVLPSFLGCFFDYTSARLVGLMCVLGSLWFFYKSLRNFFNDSVAQLALLPPLFLVAFTQDADFVHYSSEQLPVLFLNIGLWLLSRLFENDKTPSIFRKPVNTSVGLFWLGLVLGMSPFAKIQVVPQAAVLGLFALVFTFRPQHLFKNAGALIAGALVFPLLTISWAVAFGVLDDFWDFYVLGNLIYAGGSTVLGSVLRLPAFFAKSPAFLLFLVSIGLVSFMGLVTGKYQRKRQTNLMLLVLLGLLASLYAATKSGNDFGHYLNFCIYPFALVGALFLSKIMNNQRLVWLSAACFMPFATAFGYKVLKHQPINAYVSTTDHRVPVSGVSRLILKYANYNERLVIWGWMCRYHVETQMPQGTAENHSERCIYPHSMREKYYQRYLNDLIQNRPKVFVDAVGPNSLWLNDRTTQAHEAFADLKTLIAQNYHLVGEVESTRVYVRNTEE